MSEPPSIRVLVNGEAREVRAELTLAGLIESLSLAPERIAVELNGQVVRRKDWPRAALAAGDRIEIVHFVGGG